MAPARYRRGGAGSRIRFGVGACSLGAVLVAATEKGVCAILLGDEPDGLVRDLQDRFPAAELVGGDADFEAWMARVIGLVEAPGRGHDLPLDIGGTAFQQRVWEALQAIPVGTTATYADVAGPSARRARPGRWRSPAARMPLRWRFPATGSYARTAPCRAIAGASPASATCSPARVCHEGAIVV